MINMITIPTYIYSERVNKFHGIGRTHSLLLQYIFPELKYTHTGVDLPKLNENGYNVEIKENWDFKRTRFEIYEKDLTHAGIIVGFIKRLNKLYFFDLSLPYFKDKLEDIYFKKKKSICIEKGFIFSNYFKSFQLKRKMSVKQLEEIRKYVRNLRENKVKV